MIHSPTLTTVSRPSSFSEAASIVDYAFARMDPTIAASFTEEQRHALSVALAPRRHAVNVRVSIPWGLGRSYLVVLAGRECRNTLRHPETAPHPIWSPLALAILLGVVGSGVAVFLGLLQINSAKLSLNWTPSVAPAAIPFKADASSCEESGRVWQENQCLDYTHDATF
ncbi:MAG: hypothetical protein RLZZ597_1163 [Cyanobacteriota bacterium]|jgi:hypothetical protein